MKKHKSKYAGLQKRKAISGYLFILPFILGFLLFMVKPMFQSLYMAFCEVGLEAGNISYTFTGLTNLDWAFNVDANFRQTLIDELGRMVLYSIAIIVFSFFVALILNQKFKGRALVRAVFFLPVILSSGVMLGLDTNNSIMAAVADQIAESSQGINVTAVLQDILKTSGVGVRAYEWVFELIDNIYDVALASGMQIIIFLSGMQTISSSMYEAASIDGCTAWESLWKITFPMISSLLLVNWVYTVVDFSMRTDNEVIEKIDQVLTQLQEYGHASVLAWTYFLIIGAFIGITSLLLSKVVYYND